MLQPVFSRLQIKLIKSATTEIETNIPGFTIESGKNKDWKVWEIVAFGPEAGYRDGKLVQQFEVGDQIVVHQNHVQPIEFLGKTYNFLKNDTDILAIYKKGVK